MSGIYTQLTTQHDNSSTLLSAFVKKIPDVYEKLTPFIYQTVINKLCCLSQMRIILSDRRLYFYIEIWKISKMNPKYTYK